LGPLAAGEGVEQVSPLVDSEESGEEEEEEEEGEEEEEEVVVVESREEDEDELSAEVEEALDRAVEALDPLGSCFSPAAGPLD